MLTDPESGRRLIGPEVTGRRLTIGVIGPDWPDSFADNIVCSLRSAGHTAVALGAAAPYFSTRVGRSVVGLATKSSSVELAFQRRTVQACIRLSPDLVITVDHNLRPETVTALRGSGTSVVLWFPDAVSNLGRQLSLLAPYDHVFFKDALLVERVNSQLDLPVSLLPEACNPAWHRPSTAEPGDAPGIVVVGNMYPSRVRLLERLVAADVKLRLYGSNFPRWMHGTGLEPMHTGQVVSRRDKARVFREATAVLNNLHPAEMNSVNARLFEAAGSGGVVLCERRPILDDLFDDGTEVIGFTHFEELLEAIHALHTGKMVGRVFGDAATARAHSEHTYAHRCRTMFDALGLTRVVPADSSVTDVTAR